MTDQPSTLQEKAFSQWWSAHGEWLQPQIQSQGGVSDVKCVETAQQQILHCKRQTGHLRFSLHHPFGQPAILREYRALKAFSTLGISVPKVVYCAAQKTTGEWQAQLVTEALCGFYSLEQWYEQNLQRIWGQALHLQMLKQLAMMLARIHSAGWQHGRLCPRHIFLKIHGIGTHAWVESATQDLAMSRRRWFRGLAARSDFQQLQRHRDLMPGRDWQLLRQFYVEQVASL